jgi:hypothetical protein
MESTYRIEGIDVHKRMLGWFQIRTMAFCDSQVLSVIRRVPQWVAYRRSRRTIPAIRAARTPD